MWPCYVDDRPVVFEWHKVVGQENVNRVGIGDDEVSYRRAKSVNSRRVIDRNHVVDECESTSVVASRESGERGRRDLRQ
jgi:hypothetical protein